ncbi:hypothetical protein F0919_07240 [Taibaiella lutea]|uniref:Uncharacterized protein n=1 Tax=Taibaiella lutea TaxID=2608001 RepID=A0A5M6CU15_9BACT|nr:hypothetical protein [Taibaiella lutea]KAA5537462.1 hypothetical protein F0919_07240 [Taibaiella lutea]
MKTLKLAVVALSLGFFAASCGNSESTTETPVDTMTTAPVETTPTEAAPMPADTSANPLPADTATAPAAH